jgi:very-short-patch-repair endonuclease
MSPPEVILWQHLRRQQLAGLRFRRQHPVGAYIADFYCFELGYVVEIDGESHQGDRKRTDRDRDVWMRSHRLTVIRVPAPEIRSNLAGVLRTIERRAEQLRETPKAPPPPASPAPPPSATGEDF